MPVQICTGIIQAFTHFFSPVSSVGSNTLFAQPFRQGEIRSQSANIALTVVSSDHRPIVSEGCHNTVRDMLESSRPVDTYNRYSQEMPDHIGLQEALNNPGNALSRQHQRPFAAIGLAVAGKSEVFGVALILPHLQANNMVAMAHRDQYAPGTTGPILAAFPARLSPLAKVLTMLRSQA